MQNVETSNEIEMDSDALCLEESFTDSRVGAIRRLTPVTAEGDVDASRPVRYFGSTQIMTPAGALPLSFEIGADSLSQAVARFGEAAETAIERTMDELRELQRQAASQIVVPKGGMGPGKLGGGGIQIP